MINYFGINFPVIFDDKKHKCKCRLGSTKPKRNKEKEKKLKRIAKNSKRKNRGAR